MLLAQASEKVSDRGIDRHLRQGLGGDLADRAVQDGLVREAAPHQIILLDPPDVVRSGEDGSRRYTVAAEELESVANRHRRLDRNERRDPGLAGQQVPGGRGHVEEPLLSHPIVRVEFREVAVAGVGQQDDHGAAFGDRLRGEPSNGAHDRRAGGPPDEQPLFLRQPAGHEERLVVRDLDEFIEVLEVDRFRDHVLADPLHQVRYGLSELVGPEEVAEHRAGRVYGDDADGRSMLLEVPADAAHRPSGPNGADDRSQLVRDARVDLGPGRAVVGLRVPLVLVLVREVGPRDLGRQSTGHRVEAHRVVGRHSRGRHDDPGTVRPEHPDLLGAHLVGDDDHDPVAPDGRDQGEADPGVAAGRLHDRPAGLETPILLGRLDHGGPDPVLHRDAGIEVLGLSEDAVRKTLGHPTERDQRGVPHEVEDALQPGVPSGHGGAERGSPINPCPPTGDTRVGPAGARERIRRGAWSVPHRHESDGSGGISSYGPAEVEHKYVVNVLRGAVDPVPPQGSSTGMSKRVSEPGRTGHPLARTVLAVALALVALTAGSSPAEAAGYPPLPLAFDGTFLSILSAPDLTPGSSGALTFQVADPASFAPMSAVTLTLDVYAFNAFPGNASSSVSSAGAPVLVTPTTSGAFANLSLPSLTPGTHVDGSVDVATTASTSAGTYAVRTSLSFLANGTVYRLESRGWFTARLWAAATELPNGSLTLNLTVLGVSGVTAETAVQVTSSNWDWALGLILGAAIVLVGAGAWVYFRRDAKSSSGAR